MASGARGTWIAFLFMAFAVVGLTGVFGTIAAPMARDRALAREVALDDALATPRAAEPRAALEALRPRLDDSAAAVIDGTAPLDERVAAERSAARARFAADAAATDRRLLWLVCVITAMGAAFGAAVLGAATRRA